MPIPNNRKLASSEAACPKPEIRTDSTSVEVDNCSDIVEVWPSAAVWKLHDWRDMSMELPILGDDGKIFDDDAMSLELTSPEARTDEYHTVKSAYPNESTTRRKSRTRHWPDKSTEYPRYSSFADYRRNALELSIGSGMNAGRNLMAIFEDLGETPRTRYRLKIERGRPLKQWPTAPSSEIVLPVGLTLVQICQHYSSHVWGTGLRLFMAEGWTGEEIWQALPKDARNDKAQHRKWNYLQQAMGREADRMYEEGNNPRRVPQKRKRAHLDIDTDYDDSTGLCASHQSKDDPDDLLQACGGTFNVDEFVTSESSSLEPAQRCAPTLSPIETELRESEKLAAGPLDWSNLGLRRNISSYGGRHNFPHMLPNLLHQPTCQQTATIFESETTFSADRNVHRIVSCPQSVTLPHPEPVFQPTCGPGPSPRARCSCRKYL